ncbi:hypothetical protein KI387_042227, partial [Taxus chinensis]
DWKSLLSVEYAKNKFSHDAFEGKMSDEKYKVISKRDMICNISMENIIFRSHFIILADWHKKATIMKVHFQNFKALWVTIEVLSVMVTSIGSDMHIFRPRLINSRRLGAAVDGQPGNQLWVFQTPHLRQLKDLLQQGNLSGSLILRHTCLLLPYLCDYRERMENSMECISEYHRASPFA